MAKAREGNGRHRQPWIPVVCGFCGQDCEGRRTLPGRMHVRTHFALDGTLCPPVHVGEARPVSRHLVRVRDDNQLALFD